MNSHYFKINTLIKNKSELKFYFKTDNIYLTKDSTLNCIGNISLGENISFSGDIILKDGATIEQGSNLTNVSLGIDNNIRPYSILNSVNIGENNTIGPFCFLRENVNIENNCIIGSHVEITRSSISSNVKISHYAFIGDAIIESDVIIGASVIFCNFDGKFKQNSYIAFGVFLGSATLIISPVKIGQNAIIAAGSVITKNVLSNEKIIQKRS
jgi:bifunctional UDP-N-acetylglucosamine pyrophosphorylase/glucosamine-1-phosphate N-acetyltransferase